MGLTNWTGDVPRKADVAVAKNHLGADELEALNRIVTAYLEFAELQALNRRPMYMADWIAKLDDFLQLSDRQILRHAGPDLRRSSGEGGARVRSVRERARRTFSAGREALRRGRARRQAARGWPSCAEAQEATREHAQEAMTHHLCSTLRRCRGGLRCFVGERADDTVVRWGYDFTSLRR
jgi:virulence RhuM family protein